MKEIQRRETTPSRLLRPQVLRDPTEEHRTSTWLELFFDLCFVVAVAALARGLHDDPTFGGILRFLGLFVPVWWAWMGFTWYATAFDNDDVLYRVTLLASLLVPAPERYGVWAAALFVELLTPILAVRAAYGGEDYVPRVFHPEHIPERYGLFTLIVLGESVLAAGTAGTGWEPSAVLTGILGFIIAACVWWLYFDYVGSSALELGSRTAFYWGYGHLLIYAGIAALGVGIQLAIEGAAYATEVALAAGPPVDAAGGLKVGVRAVLGGGAVPGGDKLHPLGQPALARRPGRPRAARDRGALDLPRRAGFHAGGHHVRRTARPRYALPDGV